MMMMMMMMTMMMMTTMMIMTVMTTTESATPITLSLLRKRIRSWLYAVLPFAPEDPRSSTFYSLPVLRSLRVKTDDRRHPNLPQGLLKTFRYEKRLQMTPLSISI